MHQESQSGDMTSHTKMPVDSFALFLPALRTLPMFVLCALERQWYAHRGFSSNLAGGGEIARANSSASIP